MAERLLVRDRHDLIPFARAALQRLRAERRDYAARKFVFDGATVMVRVVGGESYILIYAAGGDYEFFTSDGVYAMHADPAAGWVLGTVGKARVVADASGAAGATPWVSGVGSGVYAGSVRPVLVYSGDGDPRETGGKYPLLPWDDQFVTPVDLANMRGTPPRLLTQMGLNMQKFPQYHWWFGNDPNKLVMSVNSHAYGNTRVRTSSGWNEFSAATIIGPVGNPMFPYYVGDTEDRPEFDFSFTTPYGTLTTDTDYGGWGPSSVGNGAVRYLDRATPVMHRFWADSEHATPATRANLLNRVRAAEGAGMFDMHPYAWFKKENQLLGGGHVASQSRNWRRGCLQEIKVGQDTFRYFICADNHGEFLIYRAKNWYDGSVPKGYDIPAEYVKIVSPNYPSWVTRSDPAAYIPNDPHPNYWEWHFNKDGTRAVTTPFNRERQYVNVFFKQSEAGFAYTPVYFNTPGLGSVRWDSVQQAYSSTDLSDFQYVRVPLFVRKADAPEVTHYQLTRRQHIDNALAVEVGGYLMPAANVPWDAGYATHKNIVDAPIHPEVGYPKWALDPNDYEPAYTVTPGFMEVAIGITLADGDDPDRDFAVTLTTREVSRYTDTKRMIVGADYYIPVGRADAEYAIPEDTLLTAEIEVYHKHEEADYHAGNALVKNVSSEDDLVTRSNLPKFPVERLHSFQWHDVAHLANSSGAVLSDPKLPPPGPLRLFDLPPYDALHTDRTQEKLDDAAHLDLYGKHLYIYFVVRRSDTGGVVKRLCLAHDVSYAFGDFDTEGGFAERYTPVQYRVGYAGQVVLSSEWDLSYKRKLVGAVEAFNLRFMSFLTKTAVRGDKTFTTSYAAPVGKKPGAMTGELGNGTFSAPVRNRMLRNVQPRWELRVPGHALRTSDARHAAATDSDGETMDDGNSFADPMADWSTPPFGAVKLPSIPDDNCFTFALLSYAAEHFCGGVSLLPFSFSPDGSYAVYADRRTVEMGEDSSGQPTGLITSPISSLSTEKSGVIDVVYTARTKKFTTHKALYNKAFKDARDYSYYNPLNGELGGFATTGVWVGGKPRKADSST